MKLSEQLHYSTVRVECKKGSNTSTGTGFFYNVGDIPLLITNKHVIKDFDFCEIYLSTKESVGNNFVKTRVDFGNNLILHESNDIDLCAIIIGPVINNIERMQKKEILYSSFDKSIIPNLNSDIKPIEDILVVGYPNGIWDSYNNKPIVRSGITATWHDKNYNNKSQFLIDCSIFPGSVQVVRPSLFLIMAIL